METGAGSPSLYKLTMRSAPRCGASTEPPDVALSVFCDSGYPAVVTVASLTRRTPEESRRSALPSHMTHCVIRDIRP